MLHEGRARARARAKYPGHFGNKPKTSPIEQISYRLEPKNSPLQRVTLQYASSVRLQPFSTKENGAVDTATTIKTLFFAIFREEKRGCRSCNNN